MQPLLQSLFCYWNCCIATSALILQLEGANIQPSNIQNTVICLQKLCQKTHILDVHTGWHICDLSKIGMQIFQISITKKMTTNIVMLNFVHVKIFLLPPNNRISQWCYGQANLTQIRCMLEIDIRLNLCVDSNLIKHWNILSYFFVKIMRL